MSPEDRRRQFVGIGLRMLVDTPGRSLSLDEVAAEAGVSRGLLFHYFPTREAFQDAVVRAGGRRVLRNVTPDENVVGEQALTQIVDRFLAQIQRRREFYVALMLGRGRLAVADRTSGVRTASGVEATATTLRNGLTDLVLAAAELPDSARPVVHAWIAYVEDRAIESGPLDAAERKELVDHCVRALHLLTTPLPEPRKERRLTL